MCNLTKEVKITIPYNELYFWCDNWDFGDGEDDDYPTFRDEYPELYNDQQEGEV